ncbi:MAG: hypothetical protein JZU52_10110, partial [Lamprocystis purpurea]|nr:hypothetical protein [Lamprocystis purpurea]
MTVTEFFQKISWRSTLQIALIRILVASLLYTILWIFNNADGEASFMTLNVWLNILKFWLGLSVILAVAMAIAIPVSALSRAGVPLIGLLSLPAWLIAVGDPLVWIVWRLKPEWVPVDRFRLINAPVLSVFMADEDDIQDDNQNSNVGAPFNTDTSENDKDNPVVDFLMTCDRSPSEGLAWLSRLDEGLQSKPEIMFGRFIALRHLALDENFLSKGSPNIGSVTSAEIEQKMTSEQISFAEQALVQVAKIEAVDPSYIREMFSDNVHYGELMVDDICTIMERLDPGKVQRVLGWTKLHYFANERVGFTPKLFDDSDHEFLRNAIRQRIRPAKIVLSALSYKKGKDDNNRRFFD